MHEQFGKTADKVLVDEVDRINEIAKKLASSSQYFDPYMKVQPGMKIGSAYRPLSPKWELKFRQDDFVTQTEHQSGRLEDVLKMFERFCKGCGYNFAGFAVVDEDGIPVSGLNPMARLESEDQAKPEREF